MAAIILDARRTAFGRKDGRWRDQDWRGLSAPLIQVAATLCPPDHVLLGNALQGGNAARGAALAAGLPMTLPATTLDRQCGGGLDSVVWASALIETGRARCVLAGGVESVSSAPHRLENGQAQRQAPFTGGGHSDPDMVQAADALAVRLGHNLARLHEYAARSYERAFEHNSLGDEGPREAMTVARIAKLPPYRKHGLHSLAHMASPADGAVILTVVHEDVWRDLGRPFGLVLKDQAWVGCDPALPGLGALEAGRALSADYAKLDVIAMVEAFAAQCLAAVDGLNLPPARLNPRGGSLAIGHPYGASGAWALHEVFHVLKTRGGGTGAALAAIAGGQGSAALFHSVE